MSPAASIGRHPGGTCQLQQAACLCRACAAAFLGVYVSTFDDCVRPTLGFVTIATKTVYPVTILHDWICSHTEFPCLVPPVPGASSSAPTLPSGGPMGGRGATTETLNNPANRPRKEGDAEAAKRWVARNERAAAASSRPSAAAFAGLGTADLIPLYIDSVALAYTGIDDRYADRKTTDLTEYVAPRWAQSRCRGQSCNDRRRQRQVS